MQTITRNVHFHFNYTRFYFPNRTFLKAFVVKLFKSEGFDVNEINYIFCTDDYLIEINKQYLNHDTFTDIVTFPLSEKGQPIISDIFISIDRVKENAHTFQSKAYHELLRVIFHGALHLCGYKDKTKNEKETMRSKEDFYVKNFLVSRGTSKNK